MTTDTTQNGTHSDPMVDPGVTPNPTPNPNPRSTPKSTSRSTPKSIPDQRSLTVDVDVADRIAELAKSHKRKISAIVAIGEALARRHLANEARLDDDEWVARMVEKLG